MKPRGVQAWGQAHIHTYTHIFGRGCPFGLSIHQIAHTEGSCVLVTISDAEKTAKNEIGKKKIPGFVVTHTKQMTIPQSRRLDKIKPEKSEGRGLHFYVAWL